VPFLVNRDYDLPAYIGSKDLVFCASYSGNTEETLSAYGDAKKAGAQIVVITSGGKLAEFAKADGFPLIAIPAGYPPRTALGLMMIPVLYACEAYGLLPAQDYEAAFALVEECIKTKWTVEVEGKNVAKELATACHGRVVVLYGLGLWQGSVANRWKGQFNENSKNLAFPNAFPELNHNEILGWVKAHEQGVKQWVGIVLQDGTESEKMKARARVTAKLIGTTCEFHDAYAEGTTLLEKILTLTVLGDFVSIYLAAMNGIDPENIDWINELKAELSKIS
jgi:glucose/mannose-6-phosphate isomerase